MNTFRNTASRRAWLFVVALASSAVAAPAFAVCNPNARVQSASQTLPEVTAGSPTIVHLDGSSSTPKNGNLSFSWQYLGSVPAGYAVTLTNPNTALPTFASPDVGPAGATLNFRLNLLCQGETSSATTAVNITDVVSNYPPTAVGTVAPASIHEGDLVTLDGTTSYDLNNTPQTSGLTYQWTQVDGTGNPVVGGVTLNRNANGSVATFTAPNMANSTTGSTLHFRLTVSDGSLTNSVDKLVTVLWLNDPPVARLVCPGGVISVNEGGSVTLDGSGSSDTDDGIASYTWSQENGPPNIPVGSLTTSSISFIAPSLGYQQIGSLPFTLTVRDVHGDASSASCSVFIHDVTPPVIAVPADINVEAQSAAGTLQTYTATAFDAVDDLTPYPLGCTPPSGSVFALGATTVQCAASDSAGNHASASFKITVADHTAPVLQAHADVAVEATSNAGAIVPFDAPLVSDAVDASVTVTCAPASGSQFALGGTTVQCDAVDHAGNHAAPIQFAVNVLDTTAPVVTPPADVIAEATGPQTAVSHGTATATDAVGVTSITSDAPATFPVGGTTIHWTATDAAGNAGHATSVVTVQDTTAPAIDAHDPIDHVEATGANGASVSYDSPATHDLVDGPGAATCTPTSGSVFALGTHAVTCNATDAHGNAAAPTFFNVTVVDTTAPGIDAHDPIDHVEATGPSGAAVIYVSPATHDLVDGLGAATCVPASGATFGLGTHLVTCNATDAHGNAATATTFAVTVVDTTPPTIDAHDAIAGVEATGPAGAAVSYDSPATHDIVDGTGSATCLPASGSTFGLGTSTVLCDAHDAANNPAIQTSFTVEVVDTTPPVIEFHGDVGPVEATSAAGALVSYDLPATSDAVDGAGVAHCSPLAGSQFGLGDTNVACSAIDHANNEAITTYFKVKVRDTTAPVIAAHDNVDAEATGPSGAIVNYTAPATTDAVDGPGIASCLPASGGQFSLGAHTVTCNAQDAAGNDSTATTFTINVKDTTPPSIDAHDSIVGVEATGSSGAVVTYISPATHDIVDGPGTATCVPASGSTFGLGTSTVLCDAHDAANNAAVQTSFTVQVVDTTPPVIAAHGDVGPVEATSAAGAIATYTRPATTDAVDGPGIASCSPLSGTQFALGDTTVACSAYDQAHNAAVITYFKVKVRDSTAPVIASHADVTKEATGPSGAVVTYVAPATSDAVDGAQNATCVPASGSTFALGTTTVTCSAHDAAGNASTPTTFSVRVIDTTAPVIAAHADVLANATGNSSVLVSYTPPTASDLVDGAVAVTCLPASGSSFNVGSTAVNCSATDHAGNTARSTFNVIVSYAFGGFYRPVDNLPTVNVVKAGSAIPVKFSLGGDQGLNIFATGYPASVTTSCSAAATDAIEETVTAGGSSLSYDPTSGQYNYVWKTDKSWAGTCRQLQVKLRDGSSRWAAFNFTR